MQIDVVIPMRDMRAFALEAVASVLAQSLVPARVIVVDDGSVDGGGAALRARFGTAVEVLTLTPARGAAAARNAGVDVATAPWIAFLDADDVWAPTHLEEMVALATRLPDARLLGVGYRVGRAVPEGSWAATALRRERIDYFATYVRAPLPPISASSVLIAREALRAVGGFDSRLRYGEDGDLWARLALRYPVALSDAVTVFIRRHSASATARALAGRGDGGPKPPLAEVRAAYERGGAPPFATRRSLGRYLDHRAFGKARAQLLRGDPDNARGWLRHAAEPRSMRVRLWSAAAWCVPTRMWRGLARAWGWMKRWGTQPGRRGPFGGRRGRATGR